MLKERNKVIGGICCNGAVGEPGVEGTVTTSIPDKFRYMPMKNSRINWDALSYTQGLDKEKSETLMYNCNLMFDYLSQNDIKIHVFDIDLTIIIWPVLKRIVEKSSEKISDPEKFYEHCIEYVKKIYPHYENVMKKNNHSCIDIEACVVRDLVENIISILEQDNNE